MPNKNSDPGTEFETFTVFAQGVDGYHTCRIPSVTVSADGTVLALCEGRVGRHDHSENDIILKRSADSGQTWTKTQVVATDGKNSLNNPQVVVLSDTGRILLMYQRYPYGYHSRDIARWYKPEGLKSVVAGYEGEKVCRNYLVLSDDDGVSWSQEREITATTKYPEGISLSTGPGIGIQLKRGEHAGRILMPINTRKRPEFHTEVYTAFSDDEGESWSYGATAPEGSAGWGNEVQIVELTDGSVMLNCRSHEGNHRRKVSISRDGGESWSPLRDDDRLIDPQCMGSIIRYSKSTDGSDGLILFSNASSESERINGTVRVSHDEGNTWAKSKTICPGRFAYSCLAVFSDGRIGCLYETGEENPYEIINLARFSLDWIESEG